MTCEQLISLGFDETTKSDKRIQLRCSQCNAVFINGVACHETTCPNQKFECKGCDTILDYQGYCSEC